MLNNELSILMPSYNNVCVTLVKDIAEQCSKTGGLKYEIIVADDGSVDADAVTSNRRINDIDNCRYIERGFNAGRAAIRNFLAQSARYDILLFLDSDVKIENREFLSNYTDTECKGAVYGGVHNDKGAYDKSNLRCVYENLFETNNPYSVRNTKPYQSFRTTNFMIRREVMLKFPFDEGFKEYGYEDVLLGKALEDNKISIVHTDNAVTVDDYDCNSDFLDKTQQALRTLHNHRDVLRGYSGIINADDICSRMMLSGPLRLIYRLIGNVIYRRLCNGKPSIRLYNVYRVLYYISLREK